MDGITKAKTHMKVVETILWDDEDDDVDDDVDEDDDD